MKALGRTLIFVGFVVALVAGCTFTAHDSAGNGEVRADDTTVVWDLREPRTIVELGGDPGDWSTESDTVGENGLDVTVALPGGATVAGAWSRVSAVAENGTVNSVAFSATNEANPAEWEARIDDFVASYGGDRAAMGAFLDEAETLIESGDVVVGASFDGDTTADFTPAIELRPGGGASGDPMRVVVEWNFTLDG